MDQMRASFFSEAVRLPDPVTDELPRHDVRVLIVPQAGHDMMFDNPSGVAQAIQQVLSAVRTPA